MRPALAVASECVPVVKTGGLADVVGALPGALGPLGWEVRTLLPGYRAVMAATDAARAGAVVLEEGDLFGGAARIRACTASGLDLLILDAPHLYDRPGTPYLDPDGRDWPDNDARFAALGWMAARIAAGAIAGWRPEVLHLHDWQAGLAPVYAREMGVPVGSLLTIHNIAFHGLTAAARLPALRLPAAGFHPDGFEYFGRISALKAGLMWADRLSTVSPTYARELATPEFGMGLDGVIRAREAALTGILNGIDTDLWNPATAPHIEPFRTPRGKAPNRARLAAETGLAPGEGPLCVVVSRLTAQKGLDVLLAALPALLAGGGSLALLGSGEPGLEQAFRAAAEGSDRLAVRIGYDEALAHLMFAGADAVLVPSRFEPCGLTQLYALRYGAIPVVARTGGLADTVVHASEAALRMGVATGLQFFPVEVAALRHALADLCALHADKAAWAQLQRNAMKCPVGWDVAAPRYAALYEEIARPA